MNLDEIMLAVDELSPEERERLKVYLNERESAPPRRTAEEWLTTFRRIAHDFKGESTDEEMQEIIQAMTTKSKPSDKGL